MAFFDQAVVLIVLAILVGCLLPAARAVYRFYHWRRSLERMERTEWMRVMRSLRTPGDEVL